MYYTDENRGRIQNRQRAKQIIDFRSLLYGNKITPTDIDGLMEWTSHNAYIIYEFKLSGASVPYGQQRAIEEIVNDMQKAGKIATAFVCEHEVREPEKDIIAADAIVRKVYWRGKWYVQNERKTVKELTDSFWRYTTPGGANER